MSKSDQWVIITVVAILLLHIVVWIIGYRTNKLILFTAAVNLLSGASIIIYWSVRQLMVTQHYIETREVIVLAFEIVVIACAVYTIVAGQKSNLLKVSQYAFFGIHVTVLIAAFIFLLTFKMNKLM
ncbi:hypothetical protein QWZ08_19890 [Ferruginibacter paludis]|uniref:hypothetical protein n=1 Tax=Ferruginibacter paludis TaxID=1310417 RepID=UPI0025B50600|nr:hypothetical protein [Ferruginibacter paludis]MDN3657925.1 hypothetical protein [Ferruginibacter paludis]